VAGYSGTPLAQKLGIKPGGRVLLLGAPDSFELDAPLAKTTTALRGKEPFDVAVVFLHAKADVKKRFKEVSPRMTQEGGLWLAWPKKASKIPTDVTENLLREVILPTGWVDNKVCAIDERYSGLRFVLRKEKRK
jgi:hypothetical protein